MVNFIFTSALALLTFFPFSRETTPEVEESEATTSLACRNWYTVNMCGTYYLCLDHYEGADGGVSQNALMADVEYFNSVKC